MSLLLIIFFITGFGMASELQYDTDHPMICVCSKRKVFMKTKYEMKQIKIHIGSSDIH